MLKKMLELVFLMCFTTGLLYAGEVALVTDLNGEVTASALETAANNSDKQGTEKQRGRHEWKVEIAEMLPDGAEVRTGAESQLTIVHLVNNTEYHLGADSFAIITAEGVEGSACASVPLQLVSTNLQLGGAMQNQVGAVVADREYKSAEDAYKSTEETYKSLLAQDDESSGAGMALPERPKKLELARPNPPITSAPIQQRLPNKSISGMNIQSNDSEESRPVSEELADRFDNEVPGAPVAMETGFALPLEMISEICTNEAIPSIDGYETSPGNEHEGWMDIRLAVAILGEDVELKLCGDKGYRPLTLHIEADAQPSVALAWRLEKSGLLAQAASVWMTLQAEGMDAEKVALHLKRIKSKLLAG